MDQERGNRELLFTDEAKCVGCNRCIRNCPIFGANISYSQGGENKVRVDQERCIRCGSCVEACTHGARVFRDDTERFFADLAKGARISVVAAPAVRVNFPQYRNVIGFLKKSGVHLVYDVSFGADITTWAYLRAIKEQSLDSVIAQPCPAIVNYVEKYHPELIKDLAPIHSPTLCTAVYLRKYEKINDKIAFLSPCIAKSDEFNSPDTGGLVTYNVTYKALNEYLASRKLSLATFPEADFDNVESWLGRLYSRPGGLRENVEALVPNAWVRQIEGSRHVYHYLDAYQARRAERKPVPLLVDILNCGNGCNIGSATERKLSIDDADKAFNDMKRVLINARTRFFQKRSTDIFRQFDARLDLRDFRRTYSDRSVKLPEPTETDLDKIYRSLHKETAESRKIDCSACGYESCAQMAKAIFQGINSTGNCIDFNRREIAEEEVRIGEKTRVIDLLGAYTNEVVGVLDRVADLDLNVEVSGDFRGEFAKIKASINRILETLNLTLFEIKRAADQFSAGAAQVAAGSNDLAAGVNEQASAVEKLSDLISMVLEKTRLNVDNANKARDLSASAQVAAQNGNVRMTDLLKSMEDINTSSLNITKILKTIDDIAFQTNILALNAAVESARAGRFGKGFAVVANEVRNLAGRCSNAAKESDEYIQASVDKVAVGTKIAKDTAKALESIVQESANIAKIVEAISYTSQEQSKGIDDIHAQIQQVSHVVQNNSASSQESAATSEELTAQAMSLKERVSRFRLRDHGGA